jgi:PAS domain S-box-containing protein
MPSSDSPTSATPSKVWLNTDFDAIEAASRDSAQVLRRQVTIAAALLAALVLVQAVSLLPHTPNLENRSALIVRLALGLLALCATLILNRNQKQYLESITEALASARASDERARIAGLNVGDALVSAGEDGLIVNFNEVAERIFGYSAEEAIGQSLTILMPDRFKEAHSAGFARFLKTKQASVIGKTIELTARRKNGAEFPVELSIMHTMEGDLSFFTAIIRDITDRKHAEEELRQSEEKFRLLVQDVRDYAILMLDPGGHVVSWNEGAERLKGYQAQEIMGKHISVFYPQEDVAVGKPETELRVAREVGRFEDEGWRVRKDGSRFWANVIVTALRDEQGTLRGFAKITRDMSERNRVEREILKLNEGLKSRNDELAATNKELEAFTYSVAHDLRAPLRHIYGFSKILVEDFSKNMAPEAREFLDDILQDTERMGRLIDDLLGLAKVSRQEMNVQITGLKGIVEDVIRDIKPDLKDREIEWHVDDLPFVECDASLMRQVYSNLIANSVKYSRPRKPAIIEIGRTDIDGHLVLFVRDNGVGFNMKYADKLFGVFQRLHRSEDFEGTGVGLATVQRIIHKHNGHVWAEAELDKGATFYFTINDRQSTDIAENDAPSERSAEGLDSSAATGTTGNGRTASSSEITDPMLEIAPDSAPNKGETVNVR